MAAFAPEAEAVSADERSAPGASAGVVQGQGEEEALRLIQDTVGEETVLRKRIVAVLVFSSMTLQRYGLLGTWVVARQDREGWLHVTTAERHVQAPKCDVSTREALHGTTWHKMAAGIELRRRQFP